MTPEPGVTTIEYEVEDSGSYEVVCQNNHRSLVNIQNPKFEILFEFGCKALLDGYTIQSVANFASSIERFHEFCIKVFLSDRGSGSEFDETWKSVNNQSERQLGAFLFLYLEKLKELPPEFIRDGGDKSWISFRNKVLHKGVIHKYEDVKNKGRDVFNYIRGVRSKLSQNFSASTHQVILQDLAKKSRVQSDIKNITQLLPTVLSFNNNDFEQGLERMRKYRKLLY